MGFVGAAFEQFECDRSQLGFWGAVNKIDNPMYDFAEHWSAAWDAALQGDFVGYAKNSYLATLDLMDAALVAAPFASMAVRGARLAESALAGLRGTVTEASGGVLRAAFAEDVGSVGAGSAADSGGGNFVYRALNAADRESIDAGFGISAKNPEGTWSLGEHIVGGSSRASWANDPWIATSRDPAVAAAFDSGNGVVRINLDMVNSSTAEAWRIYPRLNGEAGLPYHYSF